MRDVLNISLPKEMAQIVKTRAKKGGYTTSEYMRHLIRLENTSELAKEIEEDKKLFKKGEGKLLKSLSDLD